MIGLWDYTNIATLYKKIPQRVRPLTGARDF